MLIGVDGLRRLIEQASGDRTTSPFLPILATFLVMQRQFVGGLTSGAVK